MNTKCKNCGADMDLEVDEVDGLGDVFICTECSGGPYYDDLCEQPEPTTFVNPKTGKLQSCRIESCDWDDQIMVESGCGSEFAADWRKKDISDGCPKCKVEVEENASEPEVLARLLKG